MIFGHKMKKSEKKIIHDGSYAIGSNDLKDHNTIKINYEPFNGNPPIMYKFPTEHYNFSIKNTESLQQLNNLDYSNYYSKL
jgi:hypothetical protein